MKIMTLKGCSCTLIISQLLMLKLHEKSIVCLYLFTLLSNIVVKQETAKTTERPMSQASNNSSRGSGIRLPMLDNPPPPPPPEQHQSPYAMGGSVPPPQQPAHGPGHGPAHGLVPPYGGPPPSHYAPQHQNPQIWGGGANYPPPPSQSGHYSGYYY